jgi:hypothetical protein
VSHANNRICKSFDRPPGRQGVSLEAQEAKIRAMSTVQSADLIDVIVDGGESAVAESTRAAEAARDGQRGKRKAVAEIAVVGQFTFSIRPLTGLRLIFHRLCQSIFHVHVRSHARKLVPDTTRIFAWR